MSGARRLVLALISHTNVGKTTLARTLLRRDVGEVLDQAHVTDATEGFLLYESPRGDQVVLSDNPGFGDSARLLRRLRGLPDPLAWLVGQVWDRFAERPLFCSQQAIRHVREQADVVLYLVNASEDPAAAGYLAPELELLAWVRRPVVLLLNQTGAPASPEARARDIARWREFASQQPCVGDVLALDAFTRCWVQEGVLYDALRLLVPEDRRDLLDELLAAWRSERLAALGASATALADLLAVAITDAEPLGAGGRRELRRAADALARRLADAVATANERLIALHGLEGEAAEALRVELSDVTAPAQTPAWQRSFWGGVLGGALGGLAADVATGGLSLGGGALVGALLGAAGGRGLAYGMELLRVDDAPRTAWSAAFLERFATDALLRYLAVAHFGRGAGSFRVRDHPALFRAAAERARSRQGELGFVVSAFRGAGPGARGEAARRLAPPLDAGLREVLAELYPEAAAWLAGP
jgi:Domain of unknown function (DUF3482)/50S ribosome-binding GTPase